MHCEKCPVKGVKAHYDSLSAEKKAEWAGKYFDQALLVDCPLGSDGCPEIYLNWLNVSSAGEKKPKVYTLEELRKFEQGLRDFRDEFLDGWIV